MEGQNLVHSKLGKEIELLGIISLTVGSMIGLKFLPLPVGIGSVNGYPSIPGVLITGVVVAFLAYLITVICMLAGDTAAGNY